MEHLSRGGQITERYLEKCLKIYLKKCPTVFHICYDPIGTHKKGRAAIGFLLGFFMGLIFYELVIVDLQFGQYTSQSLGAIIITMLSVGCATSIQALFSMKADADELKDTLSSVKELTLPIVEEIEGEEEISRLKEENDYLDELQNDTKRSEEIEQKRLRKQSKAKSEGEIYEAKYKAKIEARCEEQLSRGSERCRDMFANAYDKCHENVSWMAAWLLCWPMKLTFVCNIVQGLGGSNICNPEGKVDAGIGEGYASLKDSKNKLSENMKEANLQYQVKIAPVILDTYGASDAAKAIMHDFSTRRKIFDRVVTILKRALAFIFLKIILSAQEYHDSYLNEIEFDNVYVTTYFRKIDARRKARGSSTLLPLKKNERGSFVDPYGIKRSKLESKNLTGQTVKLILEMITATAFVLLDKLFYETLDLVRRHSYLEYTQAGHHDMSMEVRGTGVIASLIRSIIRNFNIKKRVKMVVTNQACLPQPKQLSTYIILKVYGTYLGIWFMLLGTAYTQRMRRVICSFFYRKREKRRVLYLYNESLRRRAGLFRFLKAKVKHLVRAHLLEQDMDPWLALQHRYPKLCGWLHFFACSREKCLICEERESRKGSKFRKCTTPECPFVHCLECWRDVGEICLACADLPDSESEDYGAQDEDI